MKGQIADILQQHLLTWMLSKLLLASEVEVLLGNCEDDTLLVVKLLARHRQSCEGCTDTHTTSTTGG